MTEPDGGALATPETTTDDSSRPAARQTSGKAGIADRIRASGPHGWLVLALGTASAVLLFLTEIATISYRTIGIGACSTRVDADICATSGGDAHNYALWLLALVVLVFSVGVALGRSRPAALGVIACGAIVLALALLVDYPDLDSLRGLEASYTDVAAHVGAGFWFELVGGMLAVAAGLVGLLFGREGGSPAAPRERKAREPKGRRRDPDPQLDPEAAREERRRRRAAARGES